MTLFSPSSLSLELRRLVEWVLLKCTSTVPVTLIIRYRDFVIFISHMMHSVFCKDVGTPVPNVSNVIILQLGFAGMPKRGRGGAVPGQGLVGQH
jgi:hypothetical protein